MARPRDRLPVHPFLLALIPVLTLYLHNQDQVPLGDLIPPAAIALVVAGLCYMLCGLAVKPVSKAAVLASFLLFAFFTYGHARIALKDAWPRYSNVSGLVLLAIVVAAMLAAWLVVRRAKRSLALAGSVMDVVTAVMVAMLLVSIAVTETRAGRLAAGRAALPDVDSANPEATPAAKIQRPDIYFIVCDRYPSAATAEAIYGFDNRPFLDFLIQRGFFVAESSRCNYARTDMSLATTMNMEYVGPAYDTLPPGLRRRFLYERIQNAKVWRFLREAGYRTYHLGTWWGPTRMNRSADVNVNYGVLSEFSMELYKTTLLYPIGALLDLDSHREQWIREQVKFAFLDTFAPTGPPVFVFAHFLLPHEPYVFDSSGGFQGRLRQMKVGVERGFVGQLQYTNTRLRAWVERILGDTARQSIIVLQADEGPHPPENFSSEGSLWAMRARLGILTAYRFPNSDYSVLYSGISPVNTFRVLFSKLLGEDPVLLPDRGYIPCRNGLTDVSDVAGQGSIDTPGRSNRLTAL